MAYEYFYQFYDELMKDVPYEKYLNLICEYAQNTDFLLDVGCGTGTVLITLLKKGYLVEGLDISEEMLLACQKKLMDDNLNCSLYHDDMRNINIINEYNIIYSFLDSINYLTTLNDIKLTFTNIFKALKPNGYFLFDIHSIDNVNKVFDGYCYNEIKDDYTYLWNAYVEKTTKKSTVYHELAFFLKKSNDLYQKSIEYHKQVVYPLKDYQQILEKIGFKIEKILYDFNDEIIDSNFSKIIIVAKKCST
ncbi:MAG TPA: class I SAM-dependent methyltransferase [Haloplasmataceae bacterium]